MSETKIEFDARHSRFMIYTPMWLLDKVRGLPNRKFSQPHKAWTAPVIRMNVEFLNANFADAEWSAEAREAAENALVPRLRPAKPFPRAIPLKTTPMPKQWGALDHSWGQKTVALFMAMGSGKTKVAIDLHSARYLATKVETVVVICPVSIKSTWVDEIRKHSPVLTNVSTIDMDVKGGQTVHTHEGGLRWVIVGVESLQGSQRAYDTVEGILSGTKQEKSALIVDESSKIKNPQAMRSKRCVDLGKLAEFRTIMTGTPVTQGIIDLYMQFEFLDSQIIGIGDWFSFRNRYAVMGGYEGKQILGYQNVEELMEIIKPFVYQVTKEEALPDLPPKVYMPPRLVQMSGEQRRMYKEVKADLSTMVKDKEVTAQNVLDKMRLLQQIECGFYSVAEESEFDGEISRHEYLVPGPDPKINELMYMLEETNESAIIWCRYRNQLARVAAALRDKYGDDSVVEFHGGKNEDERRQAREAFQSKTARFIVATQSAGGMGQTWTAATLVVYMSNTFSLEDREQSEDRAHRIGQDNKVKYVDIACENSVGVHVIKAVRNKQDFAKYVKRMLSLDTKLVVESA